MKRLLKFIAILGLATSAYAGDMDIQSFLAPGVSWLRLTNTFGLTNLMSTSRFMGYGPFQQITNQAMIQWSNYNNPGILYVSVLSNITATGSTTNFVVGYTNLWGGSGDISNVLVTVTNVFGPNIGGIVPVNSSVQNLLGTVALNPALDPEMGSGYYNAIFPPGPAGSTTNYSSWGTIAVTTLSAGNSTNTCLLVFAPVWNKSSIYGKDSVWEDGDARDQLVLQVTNRPWISTQITNCPVLWPGCAGLRLVSVTVNGGAATSGIGGVGILDISLQTFTPRK